MPDVDDGSNVAGLIDTRRHNHVPLQQSSQRTFIANQELEWGRYRPPSPRGDIIYAGTSSGSTEGLPDYALNRFHRCGRAATPSVSLKLVLAIVPHRKYRRLCRASER